ncbi:MAG: SufD family Fe-S cluster assembly protein, partial [Candidatus Hodarchaeota archaeon]
MSGELKKRATLARNKKATLGTDVDIMEIPEDSSEKDKWNRLEDISEELGTKLEQIGIEISGKERAGTYIQMGNEVSFCGYQGAGVEIMPINEAMVKYSWLKDYYWKAVEVDLDKYTAETELASKLMGYFIRAKKGVKEVFPLQSCLFINLDNSRQIVHNIIIAEEDSELNIITGCGTDHGVKRAMHLGVSEFYVKRNAKISFTMIHNWTIETDVRPRTGIIIEDNASFVSNYIVMSPTKSLQSNPKAVLNGKNSSVYFQTLVYAQKHSEYDLGSVAILNGENSNAEMISRVIGIDNSNVTARGLIVGNAPNSKGHLACQGLLLSSNSQILAVPQLDAKNPDVSLTHEAAVGKIAEEQILYLMSRGLSEDEATTMIIRGFLEADTTRLPKSLAEETKRL